MKALKCVLLVLPILFAARATGADEPKMKETEYYPLKVGNKWFYKLGDNKFVMEVVKLEDVDKVPTARVEMKSDGKTASYENITVKEDGVYRIAFEGIKAEPPIKILQLPAEKGKSWSVDSMVGKEKLKGTFKTGEEKIKVGDKDYETITVSSDDLDANGLKISFTIYLAKGIGMVKEVIKVEKQEVVIELEKFEPGK